VDVEANIAIGGVEEFKAAMQSLNANMQGHVQEQLANWASDVKEYAKRIVPVRTGRLQGSIFVRTLDWMVEIGAEAAYAALVEFGTRYVQARPYLFPAVQQYLPRLEQTICLAVDLAKGEAGLT